MEAAASEAEATAAAGVPAAAAAAAVTETADTYRERNEALILKRQSSIQGAPKRHIRHIGTFRGKIRQMVV